MHTLHNYIYVFSILCYNGKVNNVDLTQIKAVAFDIDGTLYRAWKFNLRVTPYFLYHSFFFLKYGLVRNIMHRTAATPEFVKLQASHMAKKLKCSQEEAEERLAQEKEQQETLLAEVTEELKAAKQARDQDIKDFAPKYTAG